MNLNWNDFARFIEEMMPLIASFLSGLALYLLPMRRAREKLELAEAFKKVISTEEDEMAYQFMTRQAKREILRCFYIKSEDGTVKVVPRYLVCILLTGLLLGAGLIIGVSFCILFDVELLELRLMMRLFFILLIVSSAVNCFGLRRDAKTVNEGPKHMRDDL